tara:strand:+ start:494 stop:679 length:186 start_codon:yes stop_codon:yes gene_type:complete
MKKFILITPLALFLSMFALCENIEAAGCSSHRNKNINVECSSLDDNCDNNKVDKKSNKVEA